MYNYFFCACTSGIHLRGVNASRAFGDWTRRQSAVTDTHYLPAAMDPRISERQQLLEKILETTRWPTKQNVTDIDPLDADTNPHNFILSEKPLPISPRSQDAMPETVSQRQDAKIEVSVEEQRKLHSSLRIPDILGQGRSRWCHCRRRSFAFEIFRERGVGRVSRWDAFGRHRESANAGAEGFDRRGCSTVA